MKPKKINKTKIHYKRSSVIFKQGQESDVEYNSIMNSLFSTFLHKQV